MAEAEKNPFTPMLQALVAAGVDVVDGSPRAAYAASVYAAEELWNLFGTLPDKTAARAGQRRLQEAIFWADQASQRVPG